MQCSLDLVNTNQNVRFAAIALSISPLNTFYLIIPSPRPISSPTHSIHLVYTLSIRCFTDLVDSNQNVRFAAIAQLALWVGSDINEKELCCLAVHNTHFMGSHDRTEKNVSGSLVGISL